MPDGRNAKGQDGQDRKSLAQGGLDAREVTCSPVAGGGLSLDIPFYRTSPFIAIYPSELRSPLTSHNATYGPDYFPSAPLPVPIRYLH